LNVLSNNSTMFIAFNKTMSNDLGISNQYQTVLDGNWTIDLMHQNSKAATKDLNGDGKIDDTDQLGTVSWYKSMYGLYASTGSRSFTKDANDLPVNNMDAGPQQLAILQDVYEFLTDKSSTVLAEDYLAKYPSDPWTPIDIDAFGSGRALYSLCASELITKLRDADADFGLLPLPKHDTNQKEYYNTLDYNSAETIAVPTTNPDPTMTGTVLQAMALASTNTVRPAYYDVLLKTKYARDNDSANMLDIMFKNRIVDLGVMFNWGGCADFYDNLCQSKSFNYASAYAGISSKINTDMQKAITAFTAAS
ncbi:MAG: hypothetical protein FWF44_10030, partial [Defluviitaleaceae bacterium]|nr:hypothetical protein [Defluviitaleaceae bacterium]